MSSDAGQVPGYRDVPLCEPHLGGNEWRYVKECLDTGWVSSAGAFVNRFEADLAAFVGSPHAVATVNGTAALHLALRVAGVEADDEVVVPALTFVAPANAVRYLGAWPTFVDVDPIYWQMDPDAVTDFLENGCSWRDGRLWNRATGRRVAAVLPVHLLGHPVDMEPVLESAARFGLPVIEDATESLGARYRGRAVGTLGDMGCFSFNGNKLITTGGGGMVTARTPEAADRVRYLSTQAKDDAVEYIHHEVGYNYRLTNLQAALGCAQLERVDDHVSAKRAIARFYADELGGEPGITTMSQATWAESVYWLYTIRLNAESIGVDSRAIMRRLAESGIQTRPLWHPLHRLRPFAGCYAHRVLVADIVYREALSLPCSVGLADQGDLLGHVVDRLRICVRTGNA